MATAAELFSQAEQLRLSGHLPAAEETCRRALALDANNAAVHHQLGLILGAQGKPEAALPAFLAAIERSPRDAQAHQNLAVTYRLLGRLDEAAAACRRALQLRPDYAAAHKHLGVILQQQGRPLDAAECCRRALALQPNFAEAHNSLGVALEQLDKLDEAAASFRAAIENNPTFADAYSNLGGVLDRLGRLDEAAVALRRAVELNPYSPGAHANLGLVLEQQGHFDEALAVTRRAVELDPGSAEAHSALGGVLEGQGQLEEAAAALGRALELNPSSPLAHANLSLVHEQQGRLDDALSVTRRAVEVDSHGAETHLNYAFALLRRGQFAEGWREYEWRIRLPDVRVPTFTQPRWTGQPLEGKTLLLAEEQGRGDTFQFIRYAKLFYQRGARVIAACRPESAGLLSTCPGLDSVAPHGTPLPAFDYYLPLASAPGALGTTLESIPADVPYLTADATLVETWRKELHAPGQFNIGIVWHGNPDNKMNARRSIPLAHFAPLAELPDVRLFSLQVREGREQLAAWAAPCPIVDLGDRAYSFADTAAVMVNLDLMITCDTAAAHLAGALGVPVWVGLSFVPDWRWLHARSDSPWYPTMRLYRQTRRGDWDSVFEPIRRDLAERLDESATS